MADLTNLGMKDHSKLFEDFNVFSFLKPKFEISDFIHFFLVREEQIEVVQKDEKISVIPKNEHNIMALLSRMEKQAKMSYDVLLPAIRKMMLLYTLSTIGMITTLAFWYNICPELFTSVLITIFKIIGTLDIITTVYFDAVLEFAKQDILKYKYFLDHKEEFSKISLFNHNETLDINNLAISGEPLTTLKTVLKSVEAEEKSATEKAKALVYKLFHQNEVDS